MQATGTDPGTVGDAPIPAANTNAAVLALAERTTGILTRLN